MTLDYEQIEGLFPSICVVQTAVGAFLEPDLDHDILSPCTALVMVANRRGVENPLARAAGVSHKCAIPVAGLPMLERVIRTLRSCPYVVRILISVETPEVLRSVSYVDDLVAAGLVSVVPSGATLSQSVLNAARLLEEADYPLLVTTGDNVLHTPEIVHGFYAVAAASPVDVAFALTPRSIVEEAYPAEAPGIGYLTFAEGEHSNCNIYMIRNSRALRVCDVMKTGGQFRSHPWRILRAVGFSTLLLYKLRRLTLTGLCARLEHLFGVSAGVVFLPHPDAPIDADGPDSLALIERILRARGGARHAA
ncbi:nucleotidyltransferase family protein [Emcibacter sp. SYSU 3D8]|uniref:nucleotidyltransferase family protein n=1 Tax=Emcibacter sp. SYSU 3D8 TaxID=3133969 RepID=UPI0031FE4CC1